MIYDIFNCNWVATRWQLFSTHIHTNNTGNVTKQTVHRTTQKYIEQRKKYIEQCKKYIEQHNNIREVVNLQLTCFSLSFHSMQQHTSGFTCMFIPCSRILLEKLNHFSASQEIPCILWNLKDYYHIYKSPPPVPPSRLLPSILYTC